MPVRLSVENPNPFLCAASPEKADLAGEDQSRTSWNHSLVAARAASGEDACLQFDGFGTWVDHTSDTDDDVTLSCMSAAGLSGYSLIGTEVGNVPKVYEWSPAAAALESVLAQAPEMVRTPLRSKASAFSPPTSSSDSATAFAFNSEASVFVPRSPQEVSMATQAPESSDVPVPGFLAPQARTPPETPTTVMLRNVPCAFTRKALLWLLNNEGFAGLYDFVYVPIDFNSKLCKGYAFVNMISEEHVPRLIRVFDGFTRWTHVSSSKVCMAALSHTQGLAANIDRYRNSPVMRNDVPDNFKPAIFLGRRKVPFPEPTKQLPEIHPKTKLQ
jgi:hypothetical protein